MSNNAIEVTIEGVRYPSWRQASIALDIPQSTLMRRERNNPTIRRSCIAERSPGNSSPVTVNGVRYSSRAKAARALDVSERAISDRVKRYGNSFDLDPLDFIRPPVMIGGKTYPNVAAASRATGISEKRIRTALDKYGSADHLLGVPSPKNPRPINIDGTWYRSIAEASEATGIRYRRLCAMKPDADGVIRLNRLPRGGIGRSGKPVTIDGVTWPTRKDAFEALGYKSSAFQNRIKADAPQWAKDELTARVAEYKRREGLA